jgi:hypothetical protein
MINSNCSTCFYGNAADSRYEPCASCENNMNWVPKDVFDGVIDLSFDDDSANTKQVSGSHYISKAIQPWDYIIANNIGYLEGNVIKYVSRWKEKNGVDDLKKAQHYLQKLIETSRRQE